jgi:hypothetical protein
MINNDLVNILRQRLAEAERGQITGILAVFEPGGFALAMQNVMQDVPKMVGELEMMKPQLAAILAQARAQAATNIVPVSGPIPPLSPEFMKKMNGG